MPNEKGNDQRDELRMFVIGFRIPCLPRPGPGRDLTIQKNPNETKEVDEREYDRCAEKDRCGITLRPIDNRWENFRS